MNTEKMNKEIMKITYRIEISHSSNLFIIICLGQPRQSLRVQLATLGIQLIPIIFAKLSPEGVDGDDESSTISLKLSKAMWNESHQKHVHT